MVTGGGESVSIDGFSGDKVNGANVRKTGVMAKNGVSHGIGESMAQAADVAIAHASTGPRIDLGPVEHSPVSPR